MSNIIMNVTTGYQKFAKGTRLNFQRVLFNDFLATENPEGFSDFSSLKGPVLGLTILHNNMYDWCGSAFLVAPGLAITATHCFFDYLDKLRAGEASIMLIGVYQESAVAWVASEIVFGDGHDTALLAIRPFSSLPSNMTIYQFGITTRQPCVGEHVNLIGFRQYQYNFDNNHNFHVNLFGSRGIVSENFPHGRDRVLMPFHCTEIQSGTIGGMSGGVAVDDDGYVFGVISRGISNDGGWQLSYACSIWSALGMRIDLSWPEGIYKGRLAPIEIPNTIIFIEGREHFVLQEDGASRVNLWNK